ncbi:MAG: S9 family peptidase [Gemmatimonadota bacterium]|nr:S9 family peptidase [Gemmatimonadota bacterium]
MPDAALPPLIPRAVLFGNPDRASPRLSPDGRRLAYLAPVDGVLNVWVGTPGGDDARPVTNDRDRGVRVYTWAHDNHHLLYLQDKGGDENWRLYKVDPSGGAVDDLTPFDNVQAQLVAHDKRHPHDVLVALNRDDERLHDVYHLDLRTNALTPVAKNPGDVVQWVADSNLVVRAAMATTADGGAVLRVRDDEAGAWRIAATWAPQDALASGPVGFTDDGQALFLTDSRDANATRLVRLTVATGGTDVVAEDPRYDLGGVVVHPDTREVQLVAFTRARQEWTVCDPALAEDVAAIHALNPGDFDIVDRTHADDHWIVAFTRDREPVAYYRYHRPTRRGEFLFYTRSDLAQYTLAPMEPIALAARDGLPLEGYLTLPPGLPPQRLPVVLNVHGGPWHRDVWGYDPEAQWFANRGYACLQVNFRGSTGYGKHFLNAGNREWGAKMHDDLVDAVQWAIARGIADPSRVAIYGGSYGGYAALVGATFTPDLFRCALAIVGPSNLITFINTIPPYWSTFLAMLKERVGDPETEAEFLRSRSPLTHVDRIRIPLLIAQGANDPRVKRAESEQIVAAMRTKNIPHRYLVFEDEGHGFAKPENRLRFYEAAEEFLAQHLGGRAETVGTA